ncbi:jg20115 [Pararge aegeria aegeria]|uniref:Jg20115 protein n=1 Tax=Pararge aegeria aegeria TaxID=348720 RepID=A0A8S4QWF0_9NEOP|nr:jg20115 [Pararge aegeria aegeria]
MSDRSFGDYPNRSVVKNPLLSTAVTGLSIEDLTQNAVLLPAVPSQELITRQGNTKTLHSRVVSFQTLIGHHIQGIEILKEFLNN